MKEILKEFKEFAVKGNVMDLAVGIIIGTAFGKIVTSLVNDIIMPPIGFVLGSVDFTELSIALSDNTAGNAVTINYGLFLNTIIDFIIVALVIFLLIKQVNKFKKKEEPKKQKEAEEILLLRDIRDQLKRKK